MGLIRWNRLEPRIQRDARGEGEATTSPQRLEARSSAERVSRHDSVLDVDPSLPERQVTPLLAKVGSSDCCSIAVVDAGDEGEDLVDFGEAHLDLLLAVLELRELAVRWVEAQVIGLDVVDDALLAVPEAHDRNWPAAISVLDGRDDEAERCELATVLAVGWTGRVSKARGQCDDIYSPVGGPSASKTVAEDDQGEAVPFLVHQRSHRACSDSCVAPFTSLPHLLLSDILLQSLALDIGESVGRWNVDLGWQLGSSGKEEEGDPKHPLRLVDEASETGRSLAKRSLQPLLVAGAFLVRLSWGE